MIYETTVTSKGTVTIAAPIRKSLGIKPGQKLRIKLDDNNLITISPGTNMESFIKKRASITRKVPKHLKGLSGGALKDKASLAWTQNHKNV